MPGIMGLCISVGASFSGVWVGDEASVLVSSLPSGALCPFFPPGKHPRCCGATGSGLFVAPCLGTAVGGVGGDFGSGGMPVFLSSRGGGPDDRGGDCSSSEHSPEKHASRSGTDSAELLAGNSGAGRGGKGLDEGAFLFQPGVELQSFVWMVASSVQRSVVL